MKYLLKSYPFAFVVIAVAILSGFIMERPAEAGTINCTIRGAAAGPVRNGKQLIIFDVVFRNISRVEYISRVNFVDVSVHGYFRGREETYQRKVDVDWNFSPALEPGQQKGLKVKFWRKVQPQRGSFPYDDVEIHVNNINFKRAS